MRTILAVALAATPVQVIAPITAAAGETGAASTRLAEVEIYAEHRLLWRGVLRFARDTAASYSQTVQEAPAGDCAGQGHVLRSESSLRVTVGGYASSQTATSVSYAVDWNRPGDCALGVAQRSVHVSGQVDYARTDPVVIAGDGGLELRLRLR